MPKGKGHEVICPGCRESYHETTKSYKPNRDANAGMLKLKDIYISYGWDQPPPDPTAGYGFLECPNCSAPLAPSGRLEVRERELPADIKEILADTPSGDRLAIDMQQVQVDVINICPKCRETGKMTPLEDDFETENKYVTCPIHGKFWFCKECGELFDKPVKLASHSRVHKKK